MVAFSWDLIWIPIACVIGLGILVLLFGALLAVSARKGGVGKKLLDAISRGVMKFGPTRSIALRILDRALIKGDGLGPILPTDGLSSKEALQTQQLLRQMSKEKRKKLLEMSLGADKSDPEEKSRLMRDASDLIADDFSLSREQRRSVQRAQSRAANKNLKSKRKKKRR